MTDGEPPANRQEFFNAVFGAHYRKISAYAYRRGDAERAEDVAAETFLQVWRTLDRLPKDDFPNGCLPWIYGIARNVLAESERVNWRRQLLVGRIRIVDPPRPVVDPDPVDTVAVAQLLDALPDRDREVLQLHIWHGLNAVEIAELLGCAPVNVRVRLHRLRKRFGCADRDVLAA